MDNGAYNNAIIIALTFIQNLPVCTYGADVSNGFLNKSWWLLHFFISAPLALKIHHDYVAIKWITSDILTPTSAVRYFQ